MTKPIPASTGALLTAPDITIIGGGPIGCLTALCLAEALPQTRTIRLIAGRRTPVEDGRAAALVGRSMAILNALGLEDVFRQNGAALAGIRIIDVTGRLIRAPTTLFHARDAGQDDFGVSLSTARIVALLMEAMRERGRVQILPVDVTAVERRGDGFSLTDDEGRTHQAPFVIAADGQRSLAREAADIPVRRWSYPQAALTFAVSQSVDHEDISTEFHTADGPFTLVPAGERASTVVWMTRPDEAERLLALEDAAFALAAERVCHSLLGKLTLQSPRGHYPMGGLLAKTFTAPGLALVGETGHAFPPIGAQGMNLGFRDADTLAKACAAAFAAGAANLDTAHLASWDAGRRRDAGLRTAGVDAFNRSLLSGLLPVAAVRSAGLAVLGTIAPLRRAVMRAGLAE
jgi:2-octaprenyl-6-methoxyphenol hydroxylase